VPIYILADILIYYNILSYFAFIFEPIAKFLDITPESSLAIISGMFLNLYAAVAFIAPLNLTPKEVTILAVFLGVAHSLVVESLIIKELKISQKFSYTLRIISALILAKIVTFLPDSLFNSNITNTIKIKHYNSITELLINSSINALILSLKIIILIGILIIVMDYIKKMLKNIKINKWFSIVIGLILGITYGAGVLINEAKNLSKKDILYIATFLSVCHSIIEDTLLFVIFGANMWIVILIRLIGAFIIAHLIVKILS
jgi:hypothetical protein